MKASPIKSEYTLTTSNIKNQNSRNEWGSADKDFHKEDPSYLKSLYGVPKLKIMEMKNDIKVDDQNGKARG